MIWAAFNVYGDLVADGDSYDEALAGAEARGYDEDEVIIGRITP